MHRPVNEQCGGVEAHRPPFGNWDVETGARERENGHQFWGWWHGQRLCDKEGECKTYCTDKRYEWNCCTSNVARFAPRNTQLYNYKDG